MKNFTKFQLLLSFFTGAAIAIGFISDVHTLFPGLNKIIIDLLDRKPHISEPYKSPEKRNEDHKNEKNTTNTDSTDIVDQNEAPKLPDRPEIKLQHTLRLSQNDIHIEFDERYQGSQKAGIRVTDIDPISGFQGFLCRGDIIYSINDKPLINNGNVSNKVFFEKLITSHSQFIIKYKPANSYDRMDSSPLPYKTLTSDDLVDESSKRSC